MLMVISPAKRWTMKTPSVTDKTTQPQFVAEAAELIKVIARVSPAQLLTD